MDCPDRIESKKKKQRKKGQMNRVHSNIYTQITKTKIIMSINSKYK
jgi:hypothetical protein